GRRLGLGQQRDRLLRAIGAGGLVVVGAEDQRRAPEAGRALRILRRRRGERAARLLVVEGVGQAQALIEPALRLGRARRDRAMVVAEVVVPNSTTHARLMSPPPVGKRSTGCPDSSRPGTRTPAR